MKRVTALSIILALTLGLCACKSTAARWQEQYDLGMRYLSDGNYEEAILAFNAAIEIDPMQADAYLNLANAYIGMNDFEAAREILEQGYELTGSQLLKDKLDEIQSGNIFDFWGNPRRVSNFDADGHLVWYHIYEYDGKQAVNITVYNASGTQTGYWDGFRYDEQGRDICKVEYASDDGTIVGSVENTYDEQGHIVRSNHFDLDGALTQYSTRTYGSDGNLTYIYYYGTDDTLNGYHEEIYEGNIHAGYKYYQADGTMSFYVKRRYSEDGTHIGETGYAADGSVMWEQTTEH